MLPRQTGKTTCASGFLIWYAMFRPDSQILIAAHKYAGASDIMSRVRYAYEMLPAWIKAGVTQYNRNSIEFDNGSKISATTTTENTGRGMSLTLFIVMSLHSCNHRESQGVLDITITYIEYRW